ncbi:unnamed protein product [Prorocentrum cordatum]|uniref:Uncharacterized protein n=1 Tax=Prorocentrum cordatum TaxID=2364126 RepID=A0ABN9TR31_9DINO|nr:unnamed protein product [Polarella glacialis]CAK0848423.1 unnamed protein product [Polarella glacialis]|mmetsp:Transcript_19763/g.52448  ORF Transcript_19763/g.52448 Transcript_19763/m.52448 type:complete len:171 (-) Transcript_19763:271-783(-)
MMGMVPAAASSPRAAARRLAVVVGLLGLPVTSGYFSPLPGATPAPPLETLEDLERALQPAEHPECMETCMAHTRRAFFDPCYSFREKGMHLVDPENEDVQAALKLCKDHEGATEEHFQERRGDFEKACQQQCDHETKDLPLTDVAGFETLDGFLNELRGLDALKAWALEL